MAIAIVGAITLGNDAGVSGTTVAASRTGIATGNLLACWVSWASNGGTATTCTVSDPVNGAWTAVGVPQLDATANQYLAQFYFTPTAAIVGALVVTATINASTNKKTVALLELSGQDAASKVLVTHKEGVGASSAPNLNNSAINKLPSLVVGMFQSGTTLTNNGTGGGTIGPGDTISGKSLLMSRTPTLATITTSAFGIGCQPSVTGWHGAYFVFAESGATLVKLIQRTVSVARVVNRAVTKNTTTSAAASLAAAIGAGLSRALAASGSIVNELGIGLVRTLTVSSSLSRARALGRIVSLSAAGSLSLIRGVGLSRAWTASAALSPVVRALGLMRILAVSASLTYRRALNRAMIFAASVALNAGRASVMAVLFAATATLNPRRTIGFARALTAGATLLTQKTVRSVVSLAASATLVISRVLGIRRALGAAAALFTGRGFRRDLSLGASASLTAQRALGITVRFTRAIAALLERHFLLGFVIARAGRIVRALAKGRIVHSIWHLRRVLFQSKNRRAK